MEQLHEFAFRTGHTEYLRRRREWFERADESYLVCWWVPAGHVPSVEEAMGPPARPRSGAGGCQRATCRASRRPWTAWLGCAATVCPTTPSRCATGVRPPP